MRGAIYVCGGDYGRLEERSACPDALHDWPLPDGYVDAAEVAASRLAHGWHNTRCSACGLYGWIAGRPTPHGDKRVEMTK